MARKHKSVLSYIERRKRKAPVCAKVDKTQCRKCLYRPPSYATYTLPFGCWYIMLTGKRRPSEPSPNCTAFEPYNRKERAKLDRRVKYEGIKELFGNG